MREAVVRAPHPVFAALVVAPLLLAACGGASGSTAHGPAGTTPTNGPLPPSPDGIAFDLSVVPAGFPKDVPIYSGAELQAAAQSTHATKTNYMLSFTTTDSMEKVVQFYKAKMKAPVVAETDTPSSHSLRFGDEKASERVQVHVLQKDGGKTSVELLVAVVTNGS